MPPGASVPPARKGRSACVRPFDVKVFSQPDRFSERNTYEGGMIYEKSIDGFVHGGINRRRGTLLRLLRRQTAEAEERDGFPCR